MNESFKLAKMAVVTAALRAVNTSLANSYLIRNLSEMTGLGAKLGQILGMRLGSETAPIPALDLSQVWEIIRRCAPTFVDQISHLKTVGFAASIGQSHCAQLKNGDLVCIKVQRPGIGDAVNQQLDLVIKLLMMGPPKKFAVRSQAYEEFLREKFAAELDYRIEAQVQQRLACDLGHISNIVVPEVFFADREILIQRFEDAGTLASAAHWPSYEAKSIVGRTLVEAFFSMLLKKGLLHADLHPANLGFRLGTPPRLVLYDYGSFVRLTPSSITALKILLSGSTLGQPHATLDALVSLGFEEDKLHHIPQIGAIIERFLGIILNPVAPDPANLGLNKMIRTELGVENWWFRSAGPPWFLYVMRSFFGVLNVLSQLNVKIDFRSIIERYIDVRMSWNPEITLKSTLFQSNSAPLHAKNLKVLVTEQEAEIVRLELPSRAIEDLEDLLPEQALTKLQRLGYDLKAIKIDALKNGCQPSLLFDATVESRTYRVWLE